MWAEPHPEKDIRIRAVHPAFLLRQNMKNTKNWKQGINKAQNEKSVLSWKGTSYNKFKGIYRPRALTDVKITREHCGPSGASGWHKNSDKLLDE